MPRAFLLCGLPFAGKTTLAKALVQSFGLPRVSIDEINNMRGIGFDNAWITPEDWEITYTESYRQLDEHLHAGRSTVYDAANFTRAEREQVRRIAAQSGADICVIYIATPEALVRLRWQQNRHTHERNDIRADYFELVLTRFEVPGEDEQVLPYYNEQDANIWLKAHKNYFVGIQ